MSIYTDHDRSQDSARCPSCADQMQLISVDSKSIGQIDVDVCVQCSVMWLDNAESAQLAPTSVVELFKIVNTGSDKPRLPLSKVLPCPRCKTRLTLTHDYCKAGKISYYRCPTHGRLTPFYQFLKEKHFIRQLTPLEMKQLRVEVKQIKCSGCGGSINLEKDTACSYCGAAVSVLDADAVTKAMEIWAAAAERRRSSSPEEVSEASVQLAAAHAILAENRSRSLPHALFGNASNSDLVKTCITTLSGLFALLKD